MRRTASKWARWGGCAVVFAVLVWRLGTSPFLAGLRSVDGRALAAAMALAVLTTLCCAWRWKVVAGALGVDISLSAAVAAYYRSLFLNVTLPGGVVGDIHRGISHGRAAGDVGRALRSVAWERFAGQVVQALLTVAVLLVLPSPARSVMPLVAVAAVVGVLGVLLIARAGSGCAQSAWTRVARAAAVDIRSGILARRAWPVIVVASALVVCGHVATFLLAARTAGASAPPTRMVPLALLVMAAMVLPSVGGWGPREGVTAWAFGSAGLGAQRGLATAIVYGVMVFAACLPGAAVLALAWLRRTHSTSIEPSAPSRPTRTCTTVPTRC